MSFVCDPCKKNKQIAKSFYAITLGIMMDAQMMFFSYTFFIDLANSYSYLLRRL